MASAAESMQVLDVSTWEELEVIFRTFFWVEEIQSISLARVWNALGAR